MSLVLTPDRLTATYACLRAFPPFSRLHLPSPEWIKFVVSKDQTEHGHYRRVALPHKHRMSISGVNVGHFNTLAWVMGHEMIHLHQGIAGTETPNTVHNAEFRRLGEIACRRFGWDFKVFV